MQMLCSDVHVCQLVFLYGTVHSNLISQVSFLPKRDSCYLYSLPSLHLHPLTIFTHAHTHSPPPPVSHNHHQLPLNLLRPTSAREQHGMESSSHRWYGIGTGGAGGSGDECGGDVGIQNMETKIQNQRVPSSSHLHSWSLSNSPSPLTPSSHPHHWHHPPTLTTGTILPLSPLAPSSHSHHPHTITPSLLTHAIKE